MNLERENWADPFAPYHRMVATIGDGYIRYSMNIFTK